MRPFIDCVEWESFGSGIFAYKFPENNLSTGTQLVVRESQEAVLFGKGRLLQKFGPGKYTLTTENIPLLRSLYGIPFGGRNPFLAEVWFVNKTVPLTIDWKTDAMRIMDPDYGPLPLYACGRYGLKVMDAERFLIQLVGTIPQFTAHDLTDHFYGECVSRAKSSISAFMQNNEMGLNYVSAHLDILSSGLYQQLSEFWEKYGFRMEAFHVTTIDFDTSTPQNRELYNSYNDRVKRDLQGVTYQQEKMLEAMNNSKGGSGIMMAAVMMGSLNNGGMGNLMNNVMQPTNLRNNPPGGYNPPGSGYGQQSGGYGQQENGYGGGYGRQGRTGKRLVICAKCGAKRSPEQLFCSSCGKKYRPCPFCGRDTGEMENRCVKCGTVLQPDTPLSDSFCSYCGSHVKLTDKCCPYCGRMIRR